MYRLRLGFQNCLSRLGKVRLYNQQLGVTVGRRFPPVYSDMTAQPQPALNPKIRFAISFFVIGHLLAVIAPPLSFQARGPLGPSPVVATMLAPVEGYSQFLYIDRGYAFFAPDPGPSHLFQAAITAKDGQRVERMFPDRADQWPRLLYHRHFMLAEFLDEIYQPPGPPPELLAVDRPQAEYWIRARARYEHVRRSVVKHLERQYPGRDVVIRRVEHLLPDLVEYRRSPIALDDPQLYRVILDAPINMAGGENNLAAPAMPPEVVPPPTRVGREMAKADVDQRKPANQRDLSTDVEEQSGSQDRIDDSSVQSEPAENSP